MERGGKGGRKEGVERGGERRVVRKRNQPRKPSLHPHPGRPVVEVVVVSAQVGTPDTVAGDWNEVGGCTGRGGCHCGCAGLL